MKNRVVCVSAMVLTGIAPLMTGCKSSEVPQPAPIVDGSAAANDPASMNMAVPVNAATMQYAPVRSGTAPTGVVRFTTVAQSVPQQSGNSTGSGNSQQNEAYRYNTQQPQYDQQQQSGSQQAPQQYATGQTADGRQISSQEYDQYADLLDSSVPEATQPPPPLPVDYEQPEAPGPDYLWTPGYWDYASAGYYYVPGVWVGAPYAGALWTPGWWGYVGNGYRWHHGYWGEHVGYYGGINYGFGYIGFGYQGGYWRDHDFYYNRAVNRVNPSVVNNYVYQRNVSVPNNTYINNSRTSYYGGNGGLRRAPAPQEFAALREQRMPPMQAQVAHRQEAEANRQQFFNANKGRPQMLFAAHALQADRSLAAPGNRSNAPQSFNNGRPGGVVNGVPDQRPGEQGHQQMEAQRPWQQQPGSQGNQQQQGYQQQRGLIEQQRQGQPEQVDQQRQQFEQRRQQFETQRVQQQQMNANRPGDQQQQVQGNAQRQQMLDQRQQPDAQRLQQQQQQVNAQRQSLDAQRQQVEAQRQQQVQANTQRQQVQDQQRQQVQQPRQQDMQRQQDVQRQQFDMQRQQLNAAREQQAAQQRQQMIQQQSIQSRPVPVQPRVEVPRATPQSAPRFDAPRQAPVAPSAPHVESRPAPGGPHR